MDVFIYRTYELIINVFLLMFQIRQEKPYYIADPEVDSLVSLYYNRIYLDAYTYASKRLYLWIKLFVVVVKKLLHLLVRNQSVAIRIAK